MTRRRSSGRERVFAPSYAYARLFGGRPEHWHVDAQTPIGRWLALQDCPGKHCRSLNTNCSCGFIYPIDLVANYVKNNHLLQQGETKLRAAADGCETCSRTCSRCHQPAKKRNGQPGGQREKLHAYIGQGKKLCPGHRKQGDTFKSEAEERDKIAKGVRIFDRLWNNPSATHLIVNDGVYDLYMRYQAEAHEAHQRNDPQPDYAKFICTHLARQETPSVSGSSPVQENAPPNIDTTLEFGDISFEEVLEAMNQMVAKQAQEANNNQPPRVDTNVPRHNLSPAEVSDQLSAGHSSQGESVLDSTFGGLMGSEPMHRAYSVPSGPQPLGHFDRPRVQSDPVLPSLAITNTAGWTFGGAISPHSWVDNPAQAQAPMYPTHAVWQGYRNINHIEEEALDDVEINMEAPRQAWSTPAGGSTDLLDLSMLLGNPATGGRPVTPGRSTGSNSPAEKDSLGPLLFDFEVTGEISSLPGSFLSKRPEWQRSIYKSLSHKDTNLAKQLPTHLEVADVEKVLHRLIPYNDPTSITTAYAYDITASHIKLLADRVPPLPNDDDAHLSPSPRPGFRRHYFGTVKLHFGQFSVVSDGRLMDPERVHLRWVHECFCWLVCEVLEGDGHPTRILNLLDDQVDLFFELRDRDGKRMVDAAREDCADFGCPFHCDYTRILTGVMAIIVVTAERACLRAYWQKDWDQLDQRKVVFKHTMQVASKLMDCCSVLLYRNLQQLERGGLTPTQRGDLVIRTKIWDGIIEKLDRLYLTFIDYGVMEKDHRKILQDFLTEGGTWYGLSQRVAGRALDLKKSWDDLDGYVNNPARPRVPCNLLFDIPRDKLPTSDEIRRWEEYVGSDYLVDDDVVSKGQEVYDDVDVERTAGVKRSRVGT